jgi:hypothetical protein
MYDSRFYDSFSHSQVLLIFVKALSFERLIPCKNITRIRFSPTVRHDLLCKLLCTFHCTSGQGLACLEQSALLMMVWRTSPTVPQFRCLRPSDFQQQPPSLLLSSYSSLYARPSTEAPSELLPKSQTTPSSFACPPLRRTRLRDGTSSCRSRRRAKLSMLTSRRRRWTSRWSLRYAVSICRVDIARRSEKS